MIEARVLAVHQARPGFTARGFERGGSYDRLAAAVPVGARVLDLACGDGALLARVPNAIGIDLSVHELARARALAPEDRRIDGTDNGQRVVVRGRAQALPFAAATFDIVACHLAFMLFDDIEAVVREIDRVLRPGGSLLAVLGGGPVADPASEDAFPIFLELLAESAAPPVIGDPRARTEAGWRALFTGWSVPAWERNELVLDGTFDEVWAFLAASYESPPHPPREALARRITQPVIRCRAATFIARAIKP